MGIITSGQGFQVQSVGTAHFLVIPIGNQFQVLKCDKLSPSLVSAPVPTPATTNHKKLIQLTKQQQQIFQVISDLSIHTGLASYSNCVALYKHLIHPLAAMEVLLFLVQHVIYLGRGKQDILASKTVDFIEGVDYEKEGEMEVDEKSHVAMLVAVICMPHSDVCRRRRVQLVMI